MIFLRFVVWKQHAQNSGTVILNDGIQTFSLYLKLIHYQQKQFKYEYVNVLYRVHPDSRQRHFSAQVISACCGINGPFVYGGTNCTRGWNFVDIFFSDSVKIMRFDFMTLLGHLFPKHWFIFYIDVF